METEDQVYPSLLGELAQPRVDDCRRELPSHQAFAASVASLPPRAPWRVELGVRLIAWGCRLWVSGHHREGLETAFDRERV